jgi:phosphoglycolate phosphatase
MKVIIASWGWMACFLSYTWRMLHVYNALPAEAIRLVVFDLDGTLIDSRQDLCNSVNATLENFGLKPLPEAVIASYIGDGAAMLIRRALDLPGELPAGTDADEKNALFEKAFAFFLTYYRAHKLDYTHLYPGVLDSLEAVKFTPDGADGFQLRAMAVLTNKPVGPAVAICEGLGIADYFFNIYGGDSFLTKKPNPEGLLALMAEAGVGPHETLMVGDSDVDILTARSAGVWSLGCSFGLSPETMHAASPDVVADHASAWITALGKSI